MPSSAKTKIHARKHKPDYSIILVVSLLLIIGMIVLFSIGTALEQSTGITVGKQFVSIFLAMIAGMITYFVPITAWYRLQSYLVILAVLATSFLLFTPGGVINPDIKGAKRWLILGPISFQPSELVKFALVVYFASFLAYKSKHARVDDPKETLVPITIIMVILGFVIVILEKDLGTMLAILIIAISMMYVSGIRMRQMSLYFSSLVSVAVMAVILAPHRVERLLTFVNPGRDIQGSGYHINQALIAVGSGGLFGLGLGNSVQAYGYLPEAANDSIFAIYAEKFGFIGMMLIISLLGYLMIRLARIIQHAPNVYTRLMASGVFAWIGGHTIINVGAILGLIPLTGITLPFLSYGGSSLVFIMAAIGLALNISKYTLSDRVVSSKSRRIHEGSSHRRWHSRARHTA